MEDGNGEPEKQMQGKQSQKRREDCGRSERKRSGRKQSVRRPCSRVRSGGKAGLRILAAAFFVCTVTFAVIWVIETGETMGKVTFSRTDDVLNNPYTGYAPMADGKYAKGPGSLVYVQTTLRELEPEKGAFDFDTFEKRMHLQEAKQAGKRVVFRLVLDMPGRERHMDIPDWLYEETGDGSFYDAGIGQGYSPDYSNQAVISANREALEALGKRYGQDDFFAYIELGSLGHWGEWHIDAGSGLPKMPSEDVCREYVKAYAEAFPKGRLLMRRPYTVGKEAGAGVYNDMTGEKKDTEEWLLWIRTGETETGGQEAAESTHAESDGSGTGSARSVLHYSAQPDIYMSAPVGGEFTSGRTWDELLSENQDQTLALIRDSHMSFIGPKCPVDVKEQYQEAYDKVLSELGYRYRVSRAVLKKSLAGGKLRLSVTVVNDGSAPIYFPRKFCVYVTEDAAADAAGSAAEGGLLRMETDLDLTRLGGGEQKTVTVRLPGKYGKNTKMPGIFAGIEDPATGTCDVLMGMEAEKDDGRYRLF